MAIIYSSENDGQISATSTTSWADARDATTASSVVGGTKSSIAVYISHGAARTGGYMWKVHRSFFEFNTLSITSDVAAASLKLRGFGLTTADMFAVKSEQSAPLADTDFDAITGWVAGANNSLNVTRYSVEKTTWNNSGYNTIELNAAALADIKNLDLFKVCLIEADYDLPNNEPSSQYAGSGLFFADGTSATDPYFEYVLATAGYGNDVIGIDSGDISTINGIATANISKVNGV